MGSKSCIRDLDNHRARFYPLQLALDGFFDKATRKRHAMTHHTDAELLPCPFCGCKAHFEMDDDRWEWIECGSCGMQGNRSASLMEDCKPKLAEAWNRRAPAAPVPQGWKLVPVESTEAMARAFRADDAPGYFCMTTLRCADFSERYAAMLAAAPQPPEAAPVELPEPDAWMATPVMQSGRGATTVFCSDKRMADQWDYGGHPEYGRMLVTGLFTEQQVRDLLAAHGIQERST